MTRKDPIAAAAAVLALVAFAGSFTHVQQTVASHGQAGWLSWAIAAMPELMVGLCVVKVLRRHADASTWLVGTSAVAFTLAANLAQAEASPWGLVVAGWPAWAAVSSVMLLHTKASPAPVAAVKAPAKHQAPPAVKPHPAPVTVPAQASPGPVRPHLVTPSDTSGEASPGAEDPIVTWLRRERAERPDATRAQLLAEGEAAYGVSTSTMERRWREAFPRAA